MTTLDKFLPKEVVVEKPTGIKEAPTAKELVPSGIINKFLLEDTSQEHFCNSKDTPCFWRNGKGNCTDKRYCSFKGARVKT